jgi:hypothetical protein
MSKDIKPELFKIELEYWTEYVIAYDMVHALESIRNVDSPSAEPCASITQMTGQGKGVSDILTVAKECLPQKLVNKTSNE